jgi:hypothetical protein
MASVVTLVRTAAKSSVVTTFGKSLKKDTIIEAADRASFIEKNDFRRRIRARKALLSKAGAARVLWKNVVMRRILARVALRRKLRRSHDRVAKRMEKLPGNR